MLSASNDLINFLASYESETMKMVDLYTITLSTGTVIRFTSADFNVIVSGNTYNCKNGGISRSAISWQTGLSVDDVKVEFNPGADDFIGSVPMIEAFRNGTFDGADFRLDYAFFKNGWEGTPLVLEKVFVGTLDVEEMTGSYVKACIKSPTELLTVNFPKNSYQAACHHCLYDAGCGVLKQNHSETTTVKTGSSKKQILCNLNRPIGYYTNGVIAFSSGANAGIKRSVKENSAGLLVLSAPLLYDVAVGDTFTVSAGCNKEYAICKRKFNNASNFGGTPFVPAANSIL